MRLKLWGTGLLLPNTEGKFSEKGGGVTPIQKISLQILVPPEKTQHCFPKRGRGGSEAVWKISENLSKIEHGSVPEGNTLDVDI